MKYILSILLIAFLTGCNYKAGETAKNISAGVKKCCTSICLSKKAAGIIHTTLKDEPQPASDLPTSLLERSAEVLTW